MIFIFLFGAILNDEAFLLLENRLSSSPFRVYLDHG